MDDIDPICANSLNTSVKPLPDGERWKEIPEEIIDRIMIELFSPRWKSIAELARRNLRYPRVSEALVLSAQDPGIQKLLRRHELKIKKIFDEGLSDSDIGNALHHYGLSADLISSQVVLACLDDLEIERCEEGERFFDDLLIFMGYPSIAIFDKNAISVEKQASDLALVITEPNRARGQYVGNIVATDNQHGLIKYCRDKAVKFLFWDLPDTQCRPKLGDLVKLKFQRGKLELRVGERPTRSMIDQ